MSSTSTVCHQEIQPCAESLVKLQLVPPRPKLSNIPEEEKTHIDNKTSVDTGNWGFLQSFNTTIQTPKTETKTEDVYVHPLVKRSSSALSPRSLAMCTESLGSETGSDASSGDFSFLLQHNDIVPLLSLETEKKATTSSASKQSIIVNEESTPKMSDARAPKRMIRSCNSGNTFPPPLTSISGSNGVQFLPHREGGRLVLRAVPVASPATYFEAERGDGRLRLRLFQEVSPNCDIDEAEDEDEEEEEEEAELVEEVEVETEACWEEGEDEIEVVDGKSCGHWETEEDDDEEEELEEGLDGNSGVVVGEAGMGKKLPSRCKESRLGNNKMVMNWPPESFWVAT